MTKLRCFVPLALLAVCSACTGETNLTTNQSMGAGAQQVAVMEWQAAAVSTTTPRPSNSFLIMMR